MQPGSAWAVILRTDPREAAGLVVADGVVADGVVADGVASDGRLRHRGSSPKHRPCGELRLVIVLYFPHRAPRNTHENDLHSDAGI